MPEQKDRVWLVTGGSGQVGGALAAAPPPGVHVIAPSRALLDLADPALDVAPLLAAEDVTAIINCGAFTGVDRAEDNVDLAHQVNALAPGILARAARTAGIPIVQISTDYVFSGESPGFYREYDVTGPRCVYGRTKLAGEQAVIASGANHAILRTAWVFSAGGNNFVRNMLRLGREKDELGIVADQRGCPTHAGDLAQAIAAITAAFDGGSRASGVWHIVNSGETTWHGLATHIFARAARLGQPSPRVKPLTTAEYPTKASRPANSRLATDLVSADFGIGLRGWEAAADAVVDTIIAAEGRQA